MELLSGDYDELSGYGEEIVGADDLESSLDAILSGDDDEVGARHRRALMRQGFARRGLTKVRNTQLRRYPLGLGLTTLAASATAIISANPQLPFRVQRLVTPSSTVLIENIQVGTVSQFVAAGAVPAEVFAPNAVGVSLKGDTAVPGVSVQITVSNPDAVNPHTFSGAIIGEAAQ